MGICCYFINLFNCTILFGTQKANTGDAALVGYQFPQFPFASLINKTGQMFATLGIAAEKCSCIGFVWNFISGVLFTTVLVCCKTLTTLPFS